MRTSTGSPLFSDFRSDLSRPVRFPTAGQGNDDSGNEIEHRASREHYINGVREIRRIKWKGEREGKKRRKRNSGVSRNPFKYSIQTEPWLRCRGMNYTITKKNVLGHCEQSAPNCHIGNSDCDAG